MLAKVVEEPGGDLRSTSLRNTLGRYKRELSLIGLDDFQVASSAGKARFGRILTCSVIKALIAIPATLVGIAIHIVPYVSVKRLASIPDNDGMRATVKLLGCLLGFVTVYSLIAVIIGLRFGLPMGAVVFAAGPASGYVTVHFFERIQSIGSLVEVARLARRRQATLASLLSTREMVVTAADALLSVSTTGAGRGR